MYTLRTYALDQYPVLRLCCTQTGAFADIVPAFAGNLIALHLPTPQGNLLSVVDGYTTADELQAHSGYKSAKLLPFPNRLSDGCYTFEGQTYQLPINRPTEQHAIHGLWYNCSFEHIASLAQQQPTPQHISIELRYHYTGTQQGYPFICSVSQHIQLSAAGWQCTTTVTNTGHTNMPLADGWHPYFKLGNTPLDDCLLQLPPHLLLPLNERKLPIGTALPDDSFAQPTPLRHITLDHAYQILPTAANTLPMAHTHLHHPTQGYALQVWQQSVANTYPYLQVYTPTNRQSIAIEPMSAAANAFNNQMGLVVLAPQQSYQATYGVRLVATTF